MKLLTSEIKWIKWRDWKYNSERFLRCIIKMPQYDGYRFHSLKLASDILSVSEIILSNGLIIMWYLLYIVMILMLLMLFTTTVPLVTKLLWPKMIYTTHSIINWVINNDKILGIILMALTLLVNTLQYFKK